MDKKKKKYNKKRRIEFWVPKKRRNKDFTPLEDEDVEVYGKKIRRDPDNPQWLNLSDLNRAINFNRLQKDMTETHFNPFVNNFNPDILMDIMEFYEMNVNESMFDDIGVNQFTMTKLIRRNGMYHSTGSGRGGDKVAYCDPYVWLAIAYMMDPCAGDMAFEMFTPCVLADKIRMDITMPRLSEELYRKFGIEVLREAYMLVTYCFFYNTEDYVVNYKDPYFVEYQRNLAFCLEYDIIDDYEKFKGS